MSRQSDREQFIATMIQEGFTLDLARKLMRYAATLDRLAVARCNGDWPADNGERKVEACQSLVNRTLDGTGIKPQFHGDPRGPVLRLEMPSGRGAGWGGLAVPA